MERRKAIKNMGLAFGFTVATPTVLSILQSCQSETSAGWVPSFFSPEEGHVVKQMVDLILPKTDTPSASEVNVHIFIDAYADEVMETEVQGFMKMMAGKFVDQAKAKAGKDNGLDLTAEDIEPVLAASLNVSEEQEKANQEALGKFMEAAAKGEEAELDAGAASANFASSMRDAAIWSYKNTEEIGENVLAYQSIPGEYIGCGDLEELTGGRAYSL